MQGDFNAADRSFVRTDADSRSIESFEQMDSVAPNVISTANARIEQMEQKNNQVGKYYTLKCQELQYKPIIALCIGGRCRCICVGKQ